MLLISYVPCFSYSSFNDIDEMGKIPTIGENLEGENFVDRMLL